MIYVIIVLNHHLVGEFINLQDCGSLLTKLSKFHFKF